MVQVFVWDAAKTPDGKNVGYASMLVRQSYVGWRPEGDVWQSSPRHHRTFEADCRAEGSKPHHAVSILGLDEGAIERWWAGLRLVAPGGHAMQSPLFPCALGTRNCSTVVVEGLRVGGSDALIPWWKRMYGATTIWRPATVLSYAMDLAAASPQ
jgi:hypothetical protein